MFQYRKRFVLAPHPGCDWADKMVLNPAIIADPEHPDTLHMLFRATGPWPGAQIPGKPLPYPIFLGYAVSHDAGQTWQADFSRPAMAPALKYSPKGLWTKNCHGKKMVNYANGCIEDPRLFHFEGEVCLSVACRAFPPGPYWDHDDPVQCMPEWALRHGHRLGKAVLENSTVSLLYKVDIDKLKQQDYDHAFALVGPLHDPDISDDRDVVLFPRRLRVDGRDMIVCIHRPKHPWNYGLGKNLTAPSIFLAVADSLAELAGNKVERHLLAVPEFDWESNRIGASWAPLEISPGEWLLPYHGKQDDAVGYTQSFMILKEQDNGFPRIIHRPAERLMYASEPWELEGDFTIPCMFTCSGVIMSDNCLLMGYGAADMKIGIADANIGKLVGYIRRFDHKGKKQPVSGNSL